ncbi:hypothetical protein RJ639_044170 [Escallonia herrerae]|uniref:Retrotransposon gag domain-containing protein n=1 Tax=Escallonia herrerae TaxID=1293975 RepID=A0AA88WBT9_9ASTE|nr:hypothetical protein RJ639_044170 [Escallonia herrerae]
MVGDIARNLIPLISQDKGPRSMSPEAVHVFDVRRQWKATQICLLFQTANFKADAAQTKDIVPKDELRVSHWKCTPKGELLVRPSLGLPQKNLLPQGRIQGTPCLRQSRRQNFVQIFGCRSATCMMEAETPCEHVYQFQTNMLLLQVSDAVMCRAFPTTLRKAAHVWFKSLRPRSIHSFAQLSDLFQSHFVSSKTWRKNFASLLNVVQERNESLAHYLERFNVATLEIDNLDESVKYTAFLRGLRPTSKFALTVNKNPPGNISTLLNKDNKYIQAEEYLETHKGNRGDNSQELGKRTREDSPRDGQGPKC